MFLRKSPTLGPVARPLALEWQNFEFIYSLKVLTSSGEWAVVVHKPNLPREYQSLSRVLANIEPMHPFPSKQEPDGRLRKRKAEVERNERRRRRREKNAQLN